MRVSDMTWMQVETYLKSDDRCMVPLGSTEQHAYISLATDTTLAERVAAEAAEPLGVPVFPPLAYGLAPYFMAFPGTVTLSPATYEQVLTEVLGSVRGHGFRRIVVVNGHGGNASVRPAIEGWADRQDGVVLRWHDWWKAPQVRAAVDAIDPQGSHASWMESFSWTRVAGAAPPQEHKTPVDLSNRHELSPAGFREVIGDGCFGGWYERPDEEMRAVWEVGVRETRARLTEDW